MSENFKIPEQQNLPETGLLRLKQILQFIPISPSSWWAGIKTGRFPKPLKLGPRTTAWRVEDIRALINHGVQIQPPPQKNNVTKM